MKKQSISFYFKTVRFLILTAPRDTLDNGVVLMARKHEAVYQQIGLNIRYYRKKQHLTQEILAELADISTTYMSSIETANQNKSPSLDVLLNIADALDIKIGQLFEER